MIAPANTSAALIYLGFTPEVDFSVSFVDADAIVTWLSADPQPSQATIDAAELPAIKARKLAKIRSDARRIIDATYPSWRQQSAALGLYPSDYVAQMQADIAAVIAASNTAEDAVDAAADVTAVEAVAATWPVI